MSNKENKLIKKALATRSDKFWELYIDPESDTFGNVKESAMAAGFSKHWSTQLTYKKPEWFDEKVRDLRFISKAEKNLKKFLDMDTQNPIVTKDGEVLTKEDPALGRLKLDATRFVLERLYKKKWSPRTEIAVTAFSLADLHKVKVVEGEVVED